MSRSPLICEGSRRRGRHPAYTYHVLVQQARHLLYLDLPRPAKGFHVQFWYGETGIRYFNVFDYIASAKQPRVLQMPSSASMLLIDIGFDDWFPGRALGQQGEELLFSQHRFNDDSHLDLVEDAESWALALYPR